MIENKNERGVTLIELLITLAIIAILAAFALPNFRDSSLSSNRAEAQAMLRKIELGMERYYTINGEYTDLIKAGNGFPSELMWGSNVAYKLSIDIPANKESYTLVAEAVNGQADDDCGKLSLFSTGKVQADHAKCW
jgi:type IV pilus assembly protein PilE